MMEEFTWCHGMYGDLKEFVFDQEVAPTSWCKTAPPTMGAVPHHHHPHRHGCRIPNFWSPLMDQTVAEDDDDDDEDDENKDVSHHIGTTTTTTTTTNATTTTALTTTHHTSSSPYFDYGFFFSNQIKTKVLSPYDKTDTDVLTPSIMSRLQNYMPLAKRGESFWLKYSLVRDGASLDTMLNKIKGVESTIMAIETVDGEVFGCYCGQAWHRSLDFYGSGEAFLWKCQTTRSKSYDYTSNTNSSPNNKNNHNHSLLSPLSPSSTTMMEDARDEQATNKEGDDQEDCNKNEEQEEESSILESLSEEDKENRKKKKTYEKKTKNNNYNNEKDDLQVYPFSFLNHNIQLCQQDRLVVGGGFRRGDPRWGFGLCFEADLLRGSSSPCLTFSSPSLSSLHADGSTFEVRNLEVWTTTPCLSLAEAECQLRKRQFLNIPNHNHATGGGAGGGALVPMSTISRAYPFHSGGRRSNSSWKRW